MSTADSHHTTLWLPPLSPKEQQRIDRARRRQRRLQFGELSGFKGKTLWDYLNLLAILAIPVLIAVGTLWYSSQQTQATAAASAQQHQTDMNLAEDQQEETALQTYLDRMSDLLFTQHLATSQPNDEVRQVARARTITLLPHLNGVRKGEVIQFLYEAKLIESVQVNKPNGDTIVDLSGADLEGADLFAAHLDEADLSGADLSGADLEGADLVVADLEGAHLSGAILEEAKLEGAILEEAKLEGAILEEANLEGADLSGAKLERAKLEGAKLEGADLSGAILEEAKLEGAKLEGANLNKTNLSGTILPDGSKHP